MREIYKKIIELEDLYKDMRKKYPKFVDMWDKLLKLLNEYKIKVLCNIDYETQSKMC